MHGIKKFQGTPEAEREWKETNLKKIQKYQALLSLCNEKVCVSPSSFFITSSSLSHLHPHLHHNETHDAFSVSVLLSVAS